MSVLSLVVSSGRLGGFQMLTAVAATVLGIALGGWAITAGTRSPRGRAPSLASVERSLPPADRAYVLGVSTLTPDRFWGAFGTSSRPPISPGGSPKPSVPPVGTTRRPVSSVMAQTTASPILPACGPGPCWHSLQIRPRPMAQ